MVSEGSPAGRWEMQSLGPLVGLTQDSLPLAGPSGRGEYAQDSVQTGVSPGVSTEARREGDSKASFRRWILVRKQEFAAKFQRFPFQNLLISCSFPPSQLSLPSPSHIPLSSKNVLASPQPGFSALTHVPCQAPRDQ